MLASGCLAELLLPAAILFAAHLCLLAWERVAWPSGQTSLAAAAALVLACGLLGRLGRSGKAAEAQVPRPLPPKLREEDASPALSLSDGDLSPSRAGAWPRRSWFSGCFPFLDRLNGQRTPRRSDREVEVDESKASAKFCGLRWARPPEAAEAEGGGPPLPPCEAFAPEPLGGPMPEAWEGRLGLRPPERAALAELRGSVAHIAGPKDPVTLVRFLRARGGQPKAAAQMYKKAMDTRVQPGLEQAFRFRSLDDSLHQRLDRYWKPLGLLGFDRDGDPVLWERLGVVPVALLATLPADFLLRHEVYTMARIQQAMEELMLRLDRPVVYFTAVEDLTGLGLQHLNPRALKSYQAVVRFCEDNYPEMVKRALVIRAPGIFARIWKVVKHFFDQGTRDKIQIVSGSETFSVLSKYIDPCWIPECYGGRLRVGTNEWCEPLLPRPVAGVPDPLLREVLATWRAIMADTADSG